MTETETETTTSLDAALPGSPSRQRRHGRPRSRLASSQPTGWRRWRLPLALIALVGIAGVVIAAVAWNPRSNTYLDPGNGNPDGAHALSDLLGERGFDVVRAYSPEAAMSALGPAGSAGPPATLLITRPDLLTPGQLRLLSRARADVFLVAPGPVSLAALAPDASVATHPGSVPQALTEPGCSLQAARLAGSADVAGYTYYVPARARACYLADGHPSLARYKSAGRTITILGSGTALSNAFLAQAGNAALALNLLRSRHQIVWLTPEPTVAPIPVLPSGTQRHVPPLLPAAAWLMIAQLGVALAVAVIWRARRFGPLINENLPVVVRASETVQGHARLYQSRRARDRAAVALRSAMLARVLPVLGVVRDAPPEAVTDALADRSGRHQQEIMQLLYGPPPAGDAGLVDLARNLDELEREVRSQ